MISTPDLFMSNGWMISNLGLGVGCEDGLVGTDSRLGILRNFLIFNPTLPAFPYFFFSYVGRLSDCNGNVDGSRDVINSPVTTTGSSWTVVVVVIVDGGGGGGGSLLVSRPVQLCNCSFSICSQYSANNFRFETITSSGLYSSSENELLALWKTSSVHLAEGGGGGGFGACRLMLLGHSGGLLLVIEV